MAEARAWVGVEPGRLGAWCVPCARDVTRARPPCTGCPFTSSGVDLTASALVGEQSADDPRVLMRRRPR